MAAVAGSAGCNPADFDKLVEKSPVRSVRPPDGFSNDFGKLVLPLPPPLDAPQVAARMLVGGTQLPGGLAVVDIDPAGGVKLHNAPSDLVAQFFENVAAPVKSAALRKDGKILLGTPNFGAADPTVSTPSGRVLELTIAPDAAGGLQFGLEEKKPAGANRLGLAIATGQIDGDASEDYVVLSESNLWFNGKRQDPVPDCPVLLPTYDETIAFRALAVANFKGTGQDLVAVGVPRGPAGGKVSVLRWDGAKFTCVPLIFDLKITDFGTSLASGDVDGDGKPELIVGAPPDRAFVFSCGVTCTQWPNGELRASDLPTGAPTGDFGFRVAVVDLDGDGLGEVVVSARDLTVKGQQGAGKVYIFKADRSVEDPIVIADNDPEKNAFYGYTLNALSFRSPCMSNAERKLLVVGSNNEVFTYFRLPGLTTPDPRCFDTK